MIGDRFEASIINTLAVDVIYRAVGVAHHEPNRGEVGSRVGDRSESVSQRVEAETRTTNPEPTDDLAELRVSDSALFSRAHGLPYFVTNTRLGDTDSPAPVAGR